MYQKIIKSGPRDRAAEAAFNLGNLLAGRGHVKRARAAFETAIDFAHPEWAPTAAFNLGALLNKQGDPDRARAAYQQAIDSRHPDIAPAPPSVLAPCSSSRATWQGSRGVPASD